MFVPIVSFFFFNSLGRSFANNIIPGNIPTKRALFFVATEGPLSKENKVDD